jgi:hypothetical protein
VLRRRVESLPQRPLEALFHAGLVNDLIPLPLRQTAEALGFLVMLWGRLEELINVAVLRLLRVRRVRYELVGHIDFREKIQIVKSVAFTLAPGTAWFDDI